MAGNSLKMRENKRTMQFKKYNKIKVRNLKIESKGIFEIIVIWFDMLIIK